MRYSVIIPVYNRPDEVDELLKSLTTQHFTDFEVIVVEDGSSVSCKEIVDRYTDKLDIKYFLNNKAGPGRALINEQGGGEEDSVFFLANEEYVAKENTLLYWTLMSSFPKVISMR